MELLGHIYRVLCGAFLIIGLIIIYKSLCPNVLRTRKVYLTKDQTECDQIVAGKILLGDTNILSVLEARAIANKRLVDTFGIDNAFTTKVNQRHSNYKSEVGTLLKPDWTMVAQTAREQANDYHSGNLVCLVQSFVLKMTINVFFGIDPSKLDNDSVAFVAAEINRLWTDSKVPHRAMCWKKQYKLHEALYRLVPDCDPLDPQRNAMNLILPAFETMWRVVLRCFVEVGYRSAKEKGEWIRALGVYLKHSTPLSDEACKENLDTAIVSSIVNETLRLYPPTRHIHRQFEFASGTSTLAIADVEGLHRDVRIWGFDAEHFKPSRWTSISVGSRQRKAWMPFGASPLVCPAKPEFGLRMIGILVAALVATYCDGRYELLEEGSRGHMAIAEFTGPLCRKRNSYENLFLEPNEPCA
jgi:hypothetical protein